MNMQVFDLKNNNKTLILAMGPESDGNFSVLINEKIYYFSDWGDLLVEKNFKKYKDSLLTYLSKGKIKPKIILIDLHPLFKTSQLGQELAKKFAAKLIKVQHHYAHIGAAVLDKIINNDFKINDFAAIASDGTGYGIDETIWGGEIFKFEKGQLDRVGSLEPQLLIGGDLAIKEPARMLLSVLLKLGKSADLIQQLIRPFYQDNDLAVLKKQYEQKFNCQTTTSTGRILDAVSLLLGFCDNNREYKHQPIDLLEKRSENPYDIEPEINFNQDTQREIISTSVLFEYLLNNINKDKSRLAATAQLYLAKGFYQVAQNQGLSDIYFSGGMANNKIMSQYLQIQGVYLNKKIPCGDKGISLGQLGYYILTNPRD